MQVNRWVMTWVDTQPPLPACTAPVLGPDADMLIETVQPGRIDQTVGEVEGFVLVTGRGGFAATVGLLGRLRRQWRSAAIVVGLLEHEGCDVLHLLDEGADDFVSLPCTQAEWRVRMRRAAEGRRRTLEATAPAPQARVRGFVYASPTCERIAVKLPVIAGCDANVLITGETGTGKEVCAQAIHHLSARSSRPWVAVHCGAIPAELVENELFGHVKGAYTTAHNARPGLVCEAEGGTLFLDDVDCLPLSAQAKLLRFLQEREYRPVGSNTVLQADVRVIAASNCNLYALSQQGSFRQDLYFRLNVLNVGLPSLRERRDDIAVLAQHFAQHFARELARGARELTPGALRKLLAHHWPGNVRELRHVIERAVLLARGPVLTAEDIDIDLATPAPAPAGDDDSFHAAKARAVESFERGYVEQMLSAHRGNVTHAAQAAKKDRRAFFELMRKHSIESKRFRGVQP